MQVALDPVGQNPCAAGDVSYACRGVRAQLRNDFVVRRPVYPLLQKRLVVGRRRETPEPRDGVVETAALRWCGHLIEV
jgi:hypothetical protein